MGWFGGKKRHEKEVEAAVLVATNLYEATKPDVADVAARLHYKLPDSGYRHLIFCLSTMQMACASKMKNADAVLNEVLHLLIAYAAADSAQELTGGTVDQQELANQGAAHLQEFLHRWSAYVDIVDGGNRKSGTIIVCGMLLSVESKTEASSSDSQRLWPLALWIENALPEMRSAFGNLV